MHELPVRETCRGGYLDHGMATTLRCWHLAASLHAGSIVANTDTCKPSSDVRLRAIRHRYLHYNLLRQ